MADNIYGNRNEAQADSKFIILMGITTSHQFEGC